MTTHKKLTALTALASTALLAGCAQTLVPGIGVTDSDGWGGRDEITFEAQAHTADGKEAPASVTVYQDQIRIPGEQTLEGEHFYKLTYDQLSDLAGSTLRVVVRADDPAATVSCAIKGTGYALEEGDHVNHANEAEGSGSATCTLKID